MVYFVYGITDCPACLRACAALMEADLEYVFVETDFAKSYRKQLQHQYRHSTFPIVVRKSEMENLMIGGYDDLTTHLESLALDTNLTCTLPS
jgi:glutaredoxin